MKKLVSLLLIITCLFTLGACAKKKNPVVTPTPAVNTQEGDSTEGDSIGAGEENIQQGTSESTPVVSDNAENSQAPSAAETPKVTVDPGVDLDEDILTGDDVVSSTPTPTPTQAPSSGNEDVTPTATPTAIPEATPTLPPLVDDDTVISLPMDFF